MGRQAWFGAFCCVLGMVACADDDLDDDVQLADASLDGGADAHVGEGGMDAKTDAQIDATIPDAHADAQLDAQPCAVPDFITAPQTCSSDQDCTIVGACSAGFGFYAVNVAIELEAQRHSDQTPRACAAYDGPLFHAVCEQGRCWKRRTGNACGQAPIPDGGTDPGRCSSQQELYDLVGDAGAQSGCYERCSGPSDTRCGTGLTCRESEVCSATGSPSSSCGSITVGLCRP